MQNCVIYRKWPHLRDRDELAEARQHVSSYHSYQMREIAERFHLRASLFQIFRNVPLLTQNLPNTPCVILYPVR